MARLLSRVRFEEEEAPAELRTRVLVQVGCADGELAAGAISSRVEIEEGAPGDRVVRARRCNF